MKEVADRPIYIIGAGAVGRALAVFLQNEKRKVILVRGSSNEASPTTESIKVVHANGLELEASIDITSFDHVARLDGIVLVAVKAFANLELAQKLQSKSGRFSIVLLQNGLNVERAFQSFDRLYRCVLFSSSQVREDGVLSFKPAADSPIGIVRGTEMELASITTAISTDNFSFKTDSDIQKVAWEKTIINCAFNSICPLLEQDNGIFQRDQKARALALKVLDECISVARKLHIKLDRQALEEKLMLISRTSEGQLISTYVDLLKNRRTEIDSLNLEIARIAEELGVPSWIPNS